MDFEIRKKRKHVKVEEFVKKMKEIYEKVKATLTKSQEEIKNVNRNKKKTVAYDISHDIMS